MEAKHGWLLVSHALAYMTAAKSGVTESEIEDLISLDDRVLDDIYQYHLPPTRFPGFPVYAARVYVSVYAGRVKNW